MLVHGRVVAPFGFQVFIRRIGHDQIEAGTHHLGRENIGDRDVPRRLCVDIQKQSAADVCGEVSVIEHDAECALRKKRQVFPVHG